MFPGMGAATLFVFNSLIMQIMFYLIVTKSTTYKIVGDFNCDLKLQFIYSNYQKHLLDKQIMCSSNALSLTDIFYSNLVY